MEDGPTGWNVYWPEVFSFVHPDLATTDSALNGVDVVWLPAAGSRLQIRIEFKTPAQLSLTEIVVDLRAALGLPVAQVAAMCGIKRRQFYNLLDGRDASANRERWIRLLHNVIADILGAAGGDPKIVRSAVLRPTAGGISILDAATGQDHAALASAASEISELLRSGPPVGRLRRPVLRSPRQGAADRARDFLAEYPTDGEDDPGS